MLKAVLSVSLALAAFPISVSAATDQMAVGDWGGALHHGDAAWRVRLRVVSMHDGGLAATATGFPLEPSSAPAHVAVTGERMSFSTTTGEYSGVWNQDKAEWIGTWKQADMSEPLALRWDSNSAARVMAPGARLVVPNDLPTITNVPGQLPDIIAPGR